MSGSKNFTEQVVLGELLAQTIERHTDLRVERRLNLGGTAIAHQALVSGGIDVYVEYSGTALTAIFNLPASNDANAVFAQIRDRYASVGVTTLPRLGFNNTFAILVRRTDAEQLGLKTDRRSGNRSERIGAPGSDTSSSNGRTVSAA